MNRISETVPMEPVFHFLERVAAAGESFAVLKITQDYLLSWPKERVANLQLVDGGWAPFDRDQNPLPVNTLGHLDRFQEAVHRQCVALSQASMQLTPEIIELDEMLTIANRFAKAAGTPEFKERSAKVHKRAPILKLL